MSLELTRPERVTLAAEQVRRAIEVPGPHPEYHRAAIVSLQNEWPTLWRAIDVLIKELR